MKLMQSELWAYQKKKLNLPSTCTWPTFKCGSYIQIQTSSLLTIWAAVRVWTTWSLAGGVNGAVKKGNYRKAVCVPRQICQIKPCSSSKCNLVFTSVYSFFPLCDFIYSDWCCASIPSKFTGIRVQRSYFITSAKDVMLSVPLVCLSVRILPWFLWNVVDGCSVVQERTH